MEISVYPYSEGNKIETVNTYQYTPAHGDGFLDDWIVARQITGASTAKDLSTLFSGADAVSMSSIIDILLRGGSVSGDVLITACYQGVIEGSSESLTTVKPILDLLVKRFEVTKRVYESYTNLKKFLPVNRESYKDLTLYLKMGGLFSAAYEKTGRLPYLNALLKITDSLVSVRSEISTDEMTFLAKLITEEQEHVQRILKAQGVI